MRKAKPKKILKVLLTAGPTRAYLDQVRFLSNFSSGELGFLIAKELKEKGAKIFAVVGPCNQPFENLNLAEVIHVETNDEMERAIFKVLKSKRPEWGIFSAAVLDFKPRRVGKGKTSSQRGGWKIDLVPTHKIIDRVSTHFPQLKKIGFKLEGKVLSGKKLEKFAAEQVLRRNYQGLVVNFHPQVKSVDSHRAHLYSAGKPALATNKKQIAQWAARTVFRFDSD